MYPYNEKLSIRRRGLTLFDIIFYVFVLVVLVLVLVYKNRDLPELQGIETRYIIVLFGTIILFSIIKSLVKTKKISKLTKYANREELERFEEEGIPLGAFVNDDSVIFRGLFIIAVYRSSKYIGESFTEIEVKFSEITEILKKRDNIIINFVKDRNSYNFAVSDYFENAEELIAEIERKL